MSKIYQLIPKAMAEVGAIAKGRKNQQQGYSFRGIDDAYQAFQPVFSKLGLFVVPTVLKVTREERQTKSGGALIYTTMEVKHTFYAAEDGSSFEAVTIGEAMDSGDKSSNKAMSAAMKYALLEVFCVPTEEDNDTENHSHAPLPKTTPSAPPAPPSVPPSATVGVLNSYEVKETPKGKAFIAKLTVEGKEVVAGTMDAKLAASFDIVAGSICDITLKPTAKGHEIVSIAPKI